MRADKEKGKNIWKLVGAVVVAVMFFGSTIGFVFFFGNSGGKTATNGDQQTYNYKGLDFVRTSQGWQASTSFGIITAINLPQQTLDVECDCSSINYQSLQAQKAYVITTSFSQAEENAVAELIRNARFGNIQRACLPEDADSVGCENLPLKSCEDASSETKVLIFNEQSGIESEEEGISKIITERASFTNDCLVLEGENLIKAADRIIYKAFGIE